MRTLVTLAVMIAAGLAPAGAAGASAQAAVGSLAPAAAAHGVSGHHVTGVAHEKRADPPGAKPTVVYRDLILPTRQTATMFSDGIAEVFSAGHRSAQYRMVASAGVAGSGTTALPSQRAGGADVNQALLPRAGGGSSRGRPGQAGGWPRRRSPRPA